MRKPVYLASAAAVLTLLVGCSTSSEENTVEPTTTGLSEESEASTTTSALEGDGVSTTSPVGEYDGTYRATPLEIIEYNREEYERLEREDPEHLQALQEVEESGDVEYAIDLVIEGEKCWLVSSNDGVHSEEMSEECVIDYEAGILTFINLGDDTARPIEFIDEDRLDMVIESGGKKQVYPFKKVK